MAIFKFGIIFSTWHNVSIFEQPIGGRGRDEGAANDELIEVKLVTTDLLASAALIGHNF